jgi:hypothetical protein
MVGDHDLEGYVQANPGGSKFKTVYNATTMNGDLMLDVVDSILQHLPALDQSGDYVTQNSSGYSSPPFSQSSRSPRLPSPSISLMGCTWLSESTRPPNKPPRMLSNTPDTPLDC